MVDIKDYQENKFLKVYIGEKKYEWYKSAFEAFENKEKWKFSTWAFLLGGFYIFYRKCYIEGILYSLLLSFFFNLFPNRGTISSLIFTLSLGFVSGYLLPFFVYKRYKRILNKAMKEVEYDKQLEILIKKGGTNKLIILLLLGFNIYLLWFTSFQITKYEKEKKVDFTTVQNTISDKNSDFYSIIEILKRENEYNNAINEVMVKSMNVNNKNLKIIIPTINFIDKYPFISIAEYGNDGKLLVMASIYRDKEVFEEILKYHCNLASTAEDCRTIIFEKIEKNIFYFNVALKNQHYLYLINTENLFSISNYDYSEHNEINSILKKISDHQFDFLN